MFRSILNKLSPHVPPDCRMSQFSKGCFLLESKEIFSFFTYLYKYNTINYTITCIRLRNFKDASKNVEKTHYFLYRLK